MKKLALSIVLAGMSATSFAAGGHGPAGCGLGTEYVFKNADAWYEHVLAATTNGTSGNQSFGMTSGTLGCEDANGPLSGSLAVFMNENLEPLAVDMAKGDGETLNALAALMGIKSEDKALFNTEMKQNFDKIFASAQVTPTTAHEGIMDVMSNSQELTKYLG
ncbi:DUF3015 domain-containing protein [Marinomonas sp. M1K-6]|uniref:DUF3015 domain-containing protein n=1 Tax=Marinomonas profundi TaxID=2726122 RepID=A0A847QVC2_9GAMM|nr:DUF3015 domain-containing protein [Marinomonas profundi]NLQ16808.1 DUF3015 domain-containing protein [Marinomonas profundi]UDV02541.1 DUF3015 domain-containing protein [Marinomonas profundi]